MLAFVFSCMGVILCVPFLTLFERKVLSYCQNRKGPKKISIFGLLQPIVDGVKLMVKESGSTFSSKKAIYYFSSVLMFVFSMISILILSSANSSWVFKKSFLFFLGVISCNIFPLFFSGVSSKSKYSMLGSFRGAAQVIAYEVKAVVVLLILFSSLNTYKSLYIGGTLNFLQLLFPIVFFSWLFCIVSETNRAPFDFAEGESELVSGYKTEYSGLNFTLLFLAEYSKMMMMSWVTSLLFFGKKVMWSLFMLYLFMSFRASFPRFRYDLLMMFSWKVILPMILMMFCCSVVI